MKMHSSRTFARALSICACACMLVSAPATAALPPAPVPAVSPPTACTEPQGLSADDAFAHEIDDPRTLAFLSFAENIAAKDRAAVDKRATATLPVATVDAFNTALANTCDAREVDYRTIRLVYMIATRWSVDEALNDQLAARYAIAALFFGDRIPPSARDTALAVFGTSVQQLDGMIESATTLPSPSPSFASAVSACDLPIRAKTTLPVSPDYPPDARALGVTGTVIVQVALDEHGYVRTVTLYSGKFQPDGASGTDLVTAALSAAGSSNYTPEFAKCKSVRGNYLFRAVFDRTP